MHPISIPFTKIRNSQNHGKTLRFRATVIARKQEAFLIPRSFKVLTIDGDGDELGLTDFEVDFYGEPEDNCQLAMSLRGLPVEARHRILCARHQKELPQGKGYKHKVFEGEQVRMEMVQLGLAVDSYAPDESGLADRITAFVLSDGLQSNSTYMMDAIYTGDPQTTAECLFVFRARPDDGDLENFKVTPEEHALLKRTFNSQPGAELWDKLADIASEHYKRVTHIKGRTMLHVAVDLVYHSPLEIEIDGTRKRGRMELFIIGDTRTGKGQIAEGLAKFYNLGGLVNGEQCTVAGLVGANIQMGKDWVIQWGKAPRMDRRLLIVDEAGGMPREAFGALSRVRSEGIAEITKATTDTARARVRFIWIANPKSDGRREKTMSDFTYGVQALPTVISAKEDIARLDLVFTTNTSDITDAEINRRVESASGPAKYPADLCRKLVLWSWSRKPEHITFTEEATEEIFHSAVSLGIFNVPDIPLLSGTDVRFKIARIAAAIAARLYSTDDGVHLRVTVDHVRQARDFMTRCYQQESNGYIKLSEVYAASRSRGTDVTALKMAFRQFMPVPALVETFVENIHARDMVTERELMDFTGVAFTDISAFTHAMVRAQALRPDPERRCYVLTPSFRVAVAAKYAELHPDHQR